jgi:hypothetical protein
MPDLAEISERDLAAETQRREADYRAALAETHRRGLLSGRAPWSEEFIAACLERRRLEPDWHLTTAEGARIETVPPPMFRMGWEWAALSIMSILEGVLDRPSEDVREVIPMEVAGRGLYRATGKAHVYDARRRGAFELVELLSRFLKGRTAAMFVPLPPQRRDGFKPADDDNSEAKDR